MSIFFAYKSSLNIVFKIDFDFLIQSVSQICQAKFPHGDLIIGSS